MLLFAFLGMLLMTYGFMCLFARNVLWRFAVRGRDGQRQPDRRTWDRVQIGIGVVSIGLGLYTVIMAVS